MQSAPGANKPRYSAGCIKNPDNDDDNDDDDDEDMVMRLYTLQAQSGCRPCHDECTSCLDGSASCGMYIPACRHYRQNRECVSQCSKDYYVDENRPTLCRSCHRECLSCTGPSVRNCNQCRFLTVYSRNFSYVAFDDGLINSTVQDVRFFLQYRNKLIIIKEIVSEM